MQITEPTYYGCWTDVGHYARSTSRRSVTFEVEQWCASHDARNTILVGSTAPGTRRIPEDAQVEGLARVTHWPAIDATCLAFWDRSVDSRHASHSDFWLPGCLTFEEAVSAARAAFPSIWDRYKFDVREAT